MQPFTPATIALQRMERAMAYQQGLRRAEADARGIRRAEVEARGNMDGLHPLLRCTQCQAREAAGAA